MVLDYGLEVWWVAGEALGGDYMLAGVVAFGWAGPKKQAVLERFSIVVS